MKEYFDKYSLLQKDLPEKILNYLYSQVRILDNHYGSSRDIEKDMGGFCVVIPKSDKDAKKAYREVVMKSDMFPEWKILYTFIYRMVYL